MPSKSATILWELISRLASTVLSIHISGMSGSGKAAVARLLYGRYPHGQSTFLKFNCRTLKMQSEDRRAADPAASSAEVLRHALNAPEHHVFYLEHIDCLSATLQKRLLRLFECHYCIAPPWIITSSPLPLERCLPKTGFSASLYDALDAIHIALAPPRPSMDERTRWIGPVENPKDQMNSTHCKDIDAHERLCGARVDVRKARIMEGLMSASNLDEIGLLDLAIISESVSQIADRIAAQPHGREEIFGNRKSS